MIVLDTNVLSEIFRPRPNPAVSEAIDTWHFTALFLTSVTVAEIRVGIARMPTGRRQLALIEAMEDVLADGFERRVLPFDLGSSAFYAELMATRSRAGRPISTADGQIAAICRQHGAALATRNTRDFEGLGLELIDPWAG